jgi:pimeloyl-ACP methyl ester carboxylesterase
LWLAAMAVVLAGLVAAGPVRAMDPATTGVVLMHGKWATTDGIWPVAQALRRAGFLVATPTMPWSRSRLYDRGFTGAMAEIEREAAGLAAKGARRIVVAGHSLGADAALHYATLGHPLAAVVLIAPGHYPEGRVMRREAAENLAIAKAKVAAGKGGETGWYTDYNNGGREKSIRMRASVFVSFYDPEGPAAMSVSAPRVGTVPILWIAPDDDPLTRVFARLVRPHFPPTARITRMPVVSDHLGAPEASRRQIVGWLKSLPN